MRSRIVASISPVIVGKQTAPGPVAAGSVDVSRAVGRGRNNGKENISSVVSAAEGRCWRH